MSGFGPVVEAGWLREHLRDEGLVVVDCRFVLGDPEAGERLWLAAHVPGAAFLDVDRDLSSAPGQRGRHPLPEPGAFEEAARRAGIGATSTVVAYDAAGEGGAARLWWLLRHFGHSAVAVLNGGLRGWGEAGGPVEAGEAAGEASGVAAAGAPGTGRGDFVARPRSGDTLSADELGALRLLDARAAERFRGDVEPVDPVAGHIPGATNVPFAELIPAGRFPSPDVLRERLGDEPFVAYCGSGVSACNLLVAAELAGVEARLYPGSWSDWVAGGREAQTGV